MSCNGSGWNKATKKNRQLSGCMTGGFGAFEMYRKITALACLSGMLSCKMCVKSGDIYTSTLSIGQVIQCEPPLARDNSLEGRVMMVFCN